MAELKVKSNTVSAVDLFKCIFAICVVAIHTMAFKDHGESAYFAYRTLFWSLHRIIYSLQSCGHLLYPFLSV